MGIDTNSHQDSTPSFAYFLLLVIIDGIWFADRSQGCSVECFFGVHILLFIEYLIILVLQVGEPPLGRIFYISPFFDFYSIHFLF